MFDVVPVDVFVVGVVVVVVVVVIALVVVVDVFVFVFVVDLINLVPKQFQSFEHAPTTGIVLT